MPIYIYKCPQCRKTAEILHPISECESPSKETITLITCTKHGIMTRTPQEVAFNGTGKSEYEKSLDKQKKLKERNRRVTVEQVESNDKAIVADERSRLRKKYTGKDFKGNPFRKG